MIFAREGELMSSVIKKDNLYTPKNWNNDFQIREDELCVSIEKKLWYSSGSRSVWDTKDATYYREHLLKAWNQKTDRIETMIVRVGIDE